MGDVTRATDPFEAALGPLSTIQLSAGPLCYRDRGSGRPVIFLAGLVLNSGFWRRLVPALTQPIRAIVPDLPLGAHAISMNRDADLSPAAVADLIAELLEALDVSDAVVVGNDTGGALAKLLVSRHPERVAGLVLTPCECFENFLPPIYRYLQLIPYLPGSIWLLGQSMRFQVVRRLPIAYGWLSKGPLEKAAYDSFLSGGLGSAGVRRDTAKVLRGIRRRYTVEADAALAHFERPTLIAWAREDRVFPYEHAERLVQILPNAQLTPIADSYAYIPEDQPQALAGHIDEFLARFDSTAIGSDASSEDR